MSTCISGHGEYGSHTFEDPAERFTCSWCGVLDEDAIYEALDEAERERDCGASGCRAIADRDAEESPSRARRGSVRR